MFNDCLLRIFLIIIIPSIILSKNNLQDIYQLDTCNIPEEFSYISQDEFDIRYGGDRHRAQPVVFRQIPLNKQFRQLIQIDSILNRYGNRYITVTTANTHSYKKQNIKLDDYINLQRENRSIINRWGK